MMAPVPKPQKPPIITTFTLMIGVLIPASLIAAEIRQ